MVLFFIALKIFEYKTKNGFSRHERTPHNIVIPEEPPTILLFSKTTAYRHSKTISSSKIALSLMAKRNGWFFYETEDAGIFNENELGKFDVVIWNNSTGPVLTEEQRNLFKNYIESGGSFIGIHGAGDDSHKWTWYVDSLIGAKFSHHPIINQIQETTVKRKPRVDSLFISQLSSTWTHREEWYIFESSSVNKGFTVLLEIDGTSIDPNGNILFIKDKDFGMGKEHPVAWYKNVGKGTSFYTSMGHQRAAFKDENFLALLESAIQWSIKD